VATLDLFGHKIAKGCKARFRVPIAELPDGTPVTAAVMVVRGQEDGPTLCLSGATHGDEYNGVMVISRLINGLDPAGLRGTVIGVPIMNPFAYYAEKRLNVFDYELQNLNRLFPGDPEGDLGQIIAHKLFEGVFARGNYVIDYHEGGRDFMAKYLIVDGWAEKDDSVLTRSHQMAAWFGHGVPVAVSPTTPAQRALGHGGSLNAASHARGIPSLGAELGGAGRVWEEFVSLGVAGTRNIMIGLGMTSGKPEGAGIDQLFTDVHDWPRPRHSGLLVPAEGIGLGTVVESGQLLALVYDPFGDVAEEIRASYEAMIFDTRHSAIVYPGDWTYHCGKIG
jgi:hypothetical protein